MSRQNTRRSKHKCASSKRYPAPGVFQGIQSQANMLQAHQGHNVWTIIQDIYGNRANAQRFFLAVSLFLFHKFTGTDSLNCTYEDSPFPGHVEIFERVSADAVVPDSRLRSFHIQAYWGEGQQQYTANHRKLCSVYGLSTSSSPVSRVCTGL